MGLLGPTLLSQQRLARQAVVIVVRSYHQAVREQRVKRPPPLLDIGPTCGQSIDLQRPIGLPECGEQCTAALPVSPLVALVAMSIGDVFATAQVPSTKIAYRAVLASGSPGGADERSQFHGGHRPASSPRPVAR
jgi:hypothetical protein